MGKIIGIIVAVLALAGIIYFFSRKTSPPTTAVQSPAAASEPSLAAYNNTTYGFSFSYPRRVGSSTASFTGKEVKDPADPLARFDGTLVPVGLTVEVDAKPSNFSPAFFDEQFSAEKKEQANATFALSTTTTRVGGLSAFTVEGKGNGVTEEEILLEHGAYVYSIGYSYHGSSPESAVRTVLETFSFTQ